MTGNVGPIEQEVWKKLQEVTDPEIPSISIVEMGMIQRVHVADGEAMIEVTPTFVGCPAIKIIEKTIVERVRTVPGVKEVKVQFVFEPAWTSDRISEEGREKLRKFGITPPPRTPDEKWEPVCPFCGSANTVLDNLFGPAACRSIAYCKDCRNPFEALKPIFSKLS